MRDFIKIPKKRLDELKSKKRKLNKLQKLTNTKISINEDIIIDGEGINIFQTKNILKAFGRGFSIDDSLYLLDEEYSLEIINLKDYTKSKNRMIILKSRIIGTKGKTKKYIEQYTNTKISIYGKTISIIGKWDKVNIAKKAILMLIEGCSHTTLYKWLEQKC
ncbi:MAG: RNA-processing protein [Candidatus Aenigmarchaeota archaeon]|nr:RNA-processing protein [Candidatus Aenigmarchaeota archaeon]